MFSSVGHSFQCELQFMGKVDIFGEITSTQFLLNKCLHQKTVIIAQFVAVK